MRPAIPRLLVITAAVGVAALSATSCAHSTTPREILMSCGSECAVVGALGAVTGGLCFEQTAPLLCSFYRPEPANRVDRTFEVEHEVPAKYLRARAGQILPTVFETVFMRSSALNFGVDRWEIAYSVHPGDDGRIELPCEPTDAALPVFAGPSSGMVEEALPPEWDPPATAKPGVSSCSGAQGASRHMLVRVEHPGSVRYYIERDD